MKRMILVMVSLFAVLTAVFYSCQKETSRGPEALDMGKAHQQADFINYLSVTSELLREPGLEEIFVGYDLKKLSEADRKVISGKMFKNPDLKRGFENYFYLTKKLDLKYGISLFSKEQWKVIARFGVEKGIVFLPGLQERVREMERKSSGQEASQRQTLQGCCPCSDLVDQENENLAAAVAGLSVYCLSLSQFPPAAAFCWAGVAAFYLAENNRINSTGFWCDCMVQHFGGCAY